ncbi:hypothetical protein ACFWBF_25520 [Streptomyces sp. NPDC060028]|uniref:hypothetical protein n=1 Tax=Streptomyces sp. NPDC060028 TaxID=3347041 RepID=UPI0036A71678
MVRTAHRAGLWAQTVELADGMTRFAEARLLRSLGELSWQRRRRLSAAGDYYCGRALLTADAAPAACERGRALVGPADLQLDEGAAALLSSALDAVADDPRGRYEARRVQGLVALETDGPAAAHAHCTASASTWPARWATPAWSPTPGAGRTASPPRPRRARRAGTRVRPGIWRTAA